MQRLTEGKREGMRQRRKDLLPCKEGEENI